MINDAIIRILIANYDDLIINHPVSVTVSGHSVSNATQEEGMNIHMPKSMRSIHITHYLDDRDGLYL